MLVERSELIIKDGVENDFAATMSERGIPLLSSVPGVNAFKSNPVYPEFSQILKPFVKAGAMEHFYIA